MNQETKIAEISIAPTGDYEAELLEVVKDHEVFLDNKKERKDIVLYWHYRNDNGLVFYVGIGLPKRPWDKKPNTRNRYWKHIVAKHGYTVKVIHEGLTWEDATILEKWYIKHFGRKNLGIGELVNLTDGGEGTLGHIPHNRGIPASDYTKERISAANRGRRAWNKGIHGPSLSEDRKKFMREQSLRLHRENPEWRAKVMAGLKKAAESRKGKKREGVNPLSGRKRPDISKTHKERGIAPSPLARERALAANTGSKRSPEHLAKIAAGRTAYHLREKEKRQSTFIQKELSLQMSNQEPIL